MINLSRELLAYILVAATVLPIALWLTMLTRQRQRRRLRQRGIKRYGH